MPRGMTGRYTTIKMSKRHQERVYLKAFVNDLDYSKLCKTVTKLSNELKSYKEEVKKLRREKEEQKESEMASEKKKEQHIAHLTRRNAKLESADSNLSKAKREIDDLQQQKNEILADCNAKLEATEKQVLVAEEIISQVRAQLEEAQEEIKNLNNKVHVLEKESTLLAVCARTNTVIRDDGMDNSLNERISDLSDGEDNPPSDINYNIVAENNNIRQCQDIVTNIATDFAVNSNEDHCRLSSDCADKSETVPSSADSIKPNGMAPCV